MNINPILRNRFLCATIIGLLDEFFSYRVKDNLTDRVRYNGFKIGVTRYTRIFHDQGHRKDKM